MLSTKKSKYPLYPLQKKKLVKCLGASAYCMNVLEKLASTIENISGLFCVV